LVRNQSLRRAIHAYYATVQSNLKFDPRVGTSLHDLKRLSLELGLHHADDCGALLRERLTSAEAQYFDALRRVQQDAIVQSDIAELLLAEAVSLMMTVGAELGRGDQAAS